MTITNEKIIGSKYNYFFQYEDNYLVYNTVNTKIYKIDESTFNLLKNRVIFKSSVYKNLNLIDRLRLERLAVTIQEDEEKTVYHHIQRIVYDNKLDITIIPTQACNFRCVYCFEKHDNTHMTNESEKSIINFFARNIRNYQTIKISWFGGEPLLEKNRVLNIMKSVCEIAKKHNIAVISEMITNGYFLDVETFDDLVRNNILYYEITIDGYAKFHDKLRPLINGKGTYEHIVRNLKEIQTKAKSKRFKIVIRTNVDKNNAPEYRTFAKEFSKSLNYDSRFEFLASRIVDWGGESINTIKESLIPTNNDASDFITFDEQQEFTYTPLAQSLSQLRCSAGKQNGFVIMPNATIHKCVKVSYGFSENNIKNENQYGFITNTGHLVIEEGKNAQFIQLPKILEKCTYCCWVPICISTMCPVSIAKGKSLRCKLENEQSIKEIENGLISMYKKGLYIDLSNKDSFNY